MSDESTVSSEARRKIAAARHKAHVLYQGKVVPHRSCGIALAETFNVPSRPFQALRRGGITGEGECGAIKAGEMILGYYLGDPDPAGAVTPALREAARRFRAEWLRRLDLGPGATQPGGAVVSVVCNDLTAPFAEFTGPARHRFCTSLAAGVAEIVAEILIDCRVPFDIEPVVEEEDLLS